MKLLLLTMIMFCVNANAQNIIFHKGDYKYFIDVDKVDSITFDAVAPGNSFDIIDCELYSPQSANVYASHMDILGNGDKIELSVPNLETEFAASFYGEIQDDADIGLEMSTRCATLNLDSREIKVSGASVKNEDVVYPHRLKLENNISVSVKHGYEMGIAQIIVTSNGQECVIDSVPWYGTLYNCYCRVTKGNLTDCDLIYRPKGLSKPIWIYGDSYLSAWGYYFARYGYTNYCMDGYYGVGADVALKSLKKSLTKATPKIIVWCIGMNNWESAWEGHVESYQSWEDNTKELMNICKEKNIQLILCTIPNTKTHSNRNKNSFIKKSGYSYIDINRIVGDGDGNWHEGYLSSDDIHPTDKGSKVIAIYVSMKLNKMM